MQGMAFNNLLTLLWTSISSTYHFDHLNFSGRRLCDYIKSYKLNQALEARQNPQREKVQKPSNNTVSDCSAANSTIMPSNTETVESDPDKNAIATEKESTAIATANTIASPTCDAKPTALPSLEFITNNDNCHQLQAPGTTANASSDLHLEQFALPEMTMKRWFSEIIEALHNLHTENIYCFDLHPNNILLGTRGDILLSYFYKNLQPNSFSSVKLDVTQQQSSAYIAPERPLNEHSDWWSAGIIFFELFTGHTYESCHPNGGNFYFEIQYPDEMDVGADLDSLLHGVRIIKPAAIRT